MDPTTFISAAMPSMTILLVVTFLQVIAAVAIGALLISRKTVPPVVSGIVIGMQSVAVVALTLWAAFSLASDGDGPQVAVAAGAAVLMVAPFFAIVPAVLHGIFALAAGVRDAPRRWSWLGFAAVPAALVLALPLVGGWWLGSGFWELAWLRVVPYTALLLLTLPAMAAGGGRAGQESAASAGLALALYVGIGEASVRGSFYFLSLGRFASLEDEPARLGFLANAFDTLLEPSLWWSWATVGAALLVGLIGLAPALIERGGAAVWFGIAWLGVAVLPMLFADVPLASWTALAQSIAAP